MMAPAHTHTHTQLMWIWRNVQLNQVGCSIIMSPLILCVWMHKMQRIILCRVVDLAYTCDISFWFVWLFAHLLLLLLFSLHFYSEILIIALCLSFSTFIPSVDCTLFSFWSIVVLPKLAPKINHVKLSIILFTIQAMRTRLLHTALLLTLQSRKETKLWEQPIVKIPIKMLNFYFRLKIFIFVNTICKRHTIIWTPFYSCACECVRVCVLGTPCQNYTYSTYTHSIAKHRVYMASPKYRLDFNKLLLNHRCCLIIYHLYCCVLCAFWHL